MSNKYMLLSSTVGCGEYKNRKAEVLRKVGNWGPDHSNRFGIRMYIDNTALGIEWFGLHNEDYAESQAENYVLGIEPYSNGFENK